MTIDPAPPSSRHAVVGKEAAAPSSRSGARPPPPGGMPRIFLPLLAGIAVIAAGVTAILLVTGADRSAVKRYVTLVREHKNSEAYAMLASTRRGEIGPDDLPHRLHTELLARATDVDIIDSSRGGAGRACVIASIEEPAGKHTVHFYVLDENGTKGIHSIFTKEDFGAGGLVSIEPWHCDD